MSQITITGRALYNNAPVANAAVGVSSIEAGRTDGNGIFSFTVESSGTPRSWSINGQSGGVTVGASGTAVLNASVNVGDVALAKLNGPAQELFKPEAATYGTF